MSTNTLSISIHRGKKRLSPALIAILKPTILIFLIFFPLSYLQQFFHEGGHALAHLAYGVPIKFFYTHPFPFVGFIRPALNFNNLWGHASGNVAGILVPLIIFILLWKRRSFYTLPFLLIFPWTAIFTGLSVVEINTSGDIHNILQITGLHISSIVLYAIGVIFLAVGIFFFISLLPLMGISPEDKKSLFVLPAGMLLYCALGLVVAYLIVPGSPIDVRYHLAEEIIVSANYRPFLMGVVGALLAVIYITLYRKIYKRLPAGLRTELVSLSWRNLWYPGMLCVISVILGLIAIT
jgi:hypothetical protein